MFNSSRDPEAARELWALPRRDFLVLGSAALVGAAATSVSAGTVRPIATPAAGAVLSVGYTEAAIRAPVADVAGPAPRLVAARSLRFAGNRFENGARIFVHGLTRPDRMRTAPVLIRLSTFAPIGQAYVPYLAWMYSAQPHGRINTSPTVSFVAALDEHGTLPIAVERHDVGTAQVRRLGDLISFARNSVPMPIVPDLGVLEQSGNVCRLSSGDRGDVRLRPGTYFVALRQSYAERQPDWSSLVLDGGMLSRGDRRVDFEYITLSVDAVV